MALTLTRRAGDEILLRLEADISEDELQQLITKGLRIRVTRIEERHAAISIEAPQSVSIVRTELLSNHPGNCTGPSGTPSIGDG